MQRNTAVLFYLCSCFTLLAGGCTRNEVVHTEHALTVAAASSSDRSEPSRAASLKPETLEQQKPQPGLEPGTGQELGPAQTLQPTGDAGKLAPDLESVQFDFDRYFLSPKARATLQENAEKLMSAPRIRVTISGHCDERGSDDYNLALSERRAQAAMQYLVALGVPAERLSVIGYGKEKPLAEGHDEASWGLNRRDDFQVEEP